MQNQPPIQRPGAPGTPGQMPGQQMPGQPPAGGVAAMPGGGAGSLMASRAGYSQPDVFRGDKEDEKEDENTGPLQTLDDLHIDELLHIIVDKGASDLHICQNSQPIIRLDGKLKALHFEKFTPGHAQRMLYDILSDDNINKFETTWELDFSYQLPRRARFRVNLYREKGATAAAFRLIPQKIPTVEQLNLPPILRTLCERPRGLILVTGPTGSGKSTSLAAMVNYINENHAHHIITIEDPIEYLHEHKKSIINQREVGADTKSFLNALRGSLREDPDILLVGEMRDIETISLAVTAAETGHLVFATLHTNTAAESIDRMVDVFPPEQQEQIRVQISNNIIAVVAQQLLPRAGAKGRVPANEVMIASSAIRNLIREAKTHQITSMIQMSANMGMFTMDQNLRDLYLKGLITLDDAYSRCVNKDELTKMINTPQGGPGGAQPGMGPGVRPMPTQGR